MIEHVAAGRQDVLCSWQQILPQPGQTDTTGTALEQRHAHIFFQRLDLRRYCRLAQMQQLGRLRQVPLLGDRDKRAQLVDFHSVFPSYLQPIVRADQKFDTGFVEHLHHIKILSDSKTMNASTCF